MVLEQPFWFVQRISCLDEVAGEVHRGEGVVVCCLDFRNAFDSVNSEPLDEEVRAFGMEAKVNNLMAQSLSG